MEFTIRAAAAWIEAYFFFFRGQQLSVLTARVVAGRLMAAVPHRRGLSALWCDWTPLRGPGIAPSPFCRDLV